MKREGIVGSDFAKEVYGASLEEILSEHSDLLSQYSEYALKELAKSVNAALGELVPSAYLEYSLLALHY